MSASPRETPGDVHGGGGGHGGRLPADFGCPCASPNGTSFCATGRGPSTEPLEQGRAEVTGPGARRVSSQWVLWSSRAQPVVVCRVCRGILSTSLYPLRLPQTLHPGGARSVSKRCSDAWPLLCGGWRGGIQGPPLSGAAGAQPLSAQGLLVWPWEVAEVGGGGQQGKAEEATQIPCLLCLQALLLHCRQPPDPKSKPHKPQVGDGGGHARQDRRGVTGWPLLQLRLSPHALWNRSYIPISWRRQVHRREVSCSG